MFNKKINKIKKTSKSTTGFAMLFAVLTASLLLTIGLSIFNLSFKELILSTNAKESQVAFYAADSARECALYWDVKRGAFPTCLDGVCNTEYPAVDDQGDYASIETLGQVVCNSGAEVSSVLKRDDNIGGGANSKYQADSSDTPFVKFGDSLEPEATVIVTKEWVDGIIKTTISAYGYNTSVKGRRLERGIEQVNEN
jgi:hypothetical protein